MTHEIEYFMAPNDMYGDDYTADCSCGWKSGSRPDMYFVTYEVQKHLQDTIASLKAEIEKLASLENPPMKMASEVNSVIKNCYIDKPIKIDSDHLIIQDCHFDGSEGITFERGSATNNEEAPISNPKNGEASLADQVRAELMSIAGYRCAECNARFFGLREEPESRKRQWVNHMMSNHPSLVTAIIASLNINKNGS
jgi:hypothetical protein